jgi:hypothetical protein
VTMSSPPGLRGLVGVNPGWVASRVDRTADPTAPGRRYYCRVAFGYEDVNGGNYWIDTQPSRRLNPLPVWGEKAPLNRSKHGRAITLSNGEMFEGCRRVRASLVEQLPVRLPHDAAVRAPHHQ